MTIATRTMAGLILVAGLSLAGHGVASHSLEDVEAQLAEREHYLQVVEQPAPEFTLHDAQGHPVELADYRGQVVVLWFVFASCTDVCPLHSQAIAGVQDEINRSGLGELVQFLAITTDPERDTPEVLAKYGAAQGLDAPNWVFLTKRPGEPEDATRALAQRYGLSFVPSDDGDQMHAVVTHLIDRHGTMRARYHGLKFDRTNFIVHVNALTHDHHHGTAPEPTLWETVRGLLPW